MMHSHQAQACTPSDTDQKVAGRESESEGEAKFGNAVREWKYLHGLAGSDDLSVLASRRDVAGIFRIRNGKVGVSNHTMPNGQKWYMCACMIYVSTCVHKQ